LPVSGILGDLERRCRAIDASVVYKNVDPAELGARSLDHGREIFARGNVGRHRPRAAAATAHLGRGAFGIRPV
jgi:hypothetical protein